MPRQRAMASTTTNDEEGPAISGNDGGDDVLASFQMYYPKRQRPVEAEPQTVTVLPTGKIILSNDLVELIKDQEDRKGYVFLGFNPTQRQILIRRAKPGDRGVLRLSAVKPETNHRYQIAAKAFLEQNNALPDTKCICYAQWHEAIQGVITTLPK